MPKSYVPVRQDPQKMRYIEWLTTPPDMRDPGTEFELAAELDVFPKTLYNWKHEREFKDVWAEESDAVMGGEDKRANVINNLYEVAMDRDHPRMVAAAESYLKYQKDLRPERGDNDVTAAKALSMLSAAELDDYIAKGVEAAQRAGALNGPDPQ